MIFKKYETTTRDREMIADPHSWPVDRWGLKMPRKQLCTDLDEPRCLYIKRRVDGPPGVECGRMDSTKPLEVYVSPMVSGQTDRFYRYESVEKLLEDGWVVD